MQIPTPMPTHLPQLQIVPVILNILHVLGKKQGNNTKLLEE